MQANECSTALTPLQEAVLCEVSDWAHKYFCLREIYLFGSVARGDETPASDIDLWFCYRSTRGELEESLWESFADSYNRLQEQADSWAEQLGERLGHKVGIHHPYYGPPYQGAPDDAALPAIAAALPNATLGRGKVLIVPSARHKG